MLSSTAIFKNDSFYQILLGFFHKGSAHISKKVGVKNTTEVQPNCTRIS